MRVYLAAPWRRREEAREAARKIEQAGHEITSRWLDHPGDPTDSTGTTAPDSVIRDQALEDMADILTSEAMIVLNLEKSEGKAVETGIALMANIPIISVGPRGNIFLTLAEQVDTLEDAIGALNSYGL